MFSYVTLTKISSFIYYNNLCDLVSLCWQKIKKLYRLNSRNVKDKVALPSDEKDKVRAKKREYHHSTFIIILHAKHLCIT
jgi:hypothetical protein